MEQSHVHLLRRQNSQEMDRRTLRWCQPFVVFIWRQDDWLSDVNLLYEAVRFAGERRERFLTITRSGIFPGGPYSCDTKVFATSHHNFILWLGLRFAVLPLVVRRGRYDAAALSEHISPKLGGRYPLGTYVEQQPIRQLEPPKHRVEFPFSFVHHHDWLYGTGRGVIGLIEVATFKAGSNVKGFCHFLLIATPSVSSAHSYPLYFGFHSLPENAIDFRFLFAYSFCMG
jgi:hypothetical protein